MEKKPTLRKARAVLALAVSLVPGALLAHVAPMEVRDMVAASPHVVVAVVEGRESRWNPQRSLILTDYALRIEDRLRGQAPDRLTLSIPGGTLDGVTDETCLTVRLEPGSRYLLFLNEVGQATLSPITGAAKGVYREIPDPSGSRIAAGESPAPLALKGRAVRFADFVAAMRSLAAEVESEPPARPAVPLKNGALPAKAYDPSAVRPGTAGATGAKAATGSGSLQTVHEKFAYRELAPVPIAVNPLPADSPFSPSDQEQMAYWNLYGGDVFQVLSNPTNTWAFGNGVFDLPGFPDDAQMRAQFSRSWGDLGARVLGVTFSRRQQGVILEADIALNPAYQWTLDDLEATNRSTQYSFKEVMLHELGHAWGLKHPWETQEVGWDSVMNYKSKLYYLHTLYADDADAVREAHPGVAIRDGLVSSYTTRLTDFGGSPQHVASRPSSPLVRRGASLTLVNPIKIENPGTVPLSRFTIEVYLTPQRLSFEGARRVKTIRYRGTLQPSAVQHLEVGRVPIPRNVPPGTYYLGFLLRDARDAYPANNGAWSNDGVTVQVTK